MRLPQKLYIILSKIKLIIVNGSYFNLPIINPKAWNNGTGTRILSDLFTFICRPIYCALFIIPWCVREAAFGAPVLPEVNCRFSTSWSDILLSSSVQSIFWRLPNIRKRLYSWKNGAGRVPTYFPSISCSRTTLVKQGTCLWSAMSVFLYSYRPEPKVVKRTFGPGRW